MRKEERIIKKIEEYRDEDFTYKSGHILGSMCTQPFPIAKKAYTQFMETNLGDPKLFSGTKEIEKKLISFISKLLHSPQDSAGMTTSGGTEANITSMWIAKNLTGKKEVIVPKSAHFSFKKIASLMDMKLVPVETDKQYRTEVKKVKEKISDKTAAIVALAGSTELGKIDPIPELSQICQDKNIFLHVDAAFGGFVIPFLKKMGYNVTDFDFKNQGVDTISIDSHKMGCSAIPLGTLVLKDSKFLDYISVESSCVSSEKQAGLMGTRSGGPVAAAYTVTQFLGREGYKKIVENCMDNTYYTKKRLEEIGLELLTDPTMNVLGVKLDEPKKISKKLTEKGWKVNIMDRISCIRLVLMPHVKKRNIDSFIPDLKKVCEQENEI